MKKVFMMIMMAMVTIPGISAVMCSKNDTVTIMLDPSINGNGRGYNSTQSTWWVSFPYGTVRGLSACLSSNYGRQSGMAVSDLHDNNELVVGGEKNGGHCWCRMTHPALSAWAYGVNAYFLTHCDQNCSNRCAGLVRDDRLIRKNFFSSATQN